KHATTPAATNPPKAAYAHPDAPQARPPQPRSPCGQSRQSSPSPPASSKIPWSASSPRPSPPAAPPSPAHRDDPAASLPARSSLRQTHADACHHGAGHTTLLSPPALSPPAYGSAGTSASANNRCAATPEKAPAPGTSRSSHH